MSTRTRRICLAALLMVGMAALIFGVAHFISSREPSYHGKRLSEWIAPFCRETPTGLVAPAGPQHFEELQPVRRAVSQIGTNALPFLIGWLNHPETALHRNVRQLADKQPVDRLKLADPRVVRVRAIRALAILGPAARPAIPSLVAQLNDPLLSEHAIYALSGMGPDGMQALINQFNTVGPISRMQITMTLVSPNALYRGEGHVETNEIPIDIIVDGLGRVAQDPALPFRIPAIQRLGALGPSASNAVPALLSVLNEQNTIARQMAIRALGQIRSRPELTVPALTNLLNDPLFGTQMAALSALRAFGYEAQFQPHAPNGFQLHGGPYGGQLQGGPYVPGRTNQFRPGDRYQTAPVRTNSQ